MRFLVDESTGPAVARWLQGEGHEVLSIYEKFRGVEDDFIVAKAFEENWILITNDKDFGDKVYRERHPHNGIILLRLDNERAYYKIEVIRNLLSQYSDQIEGNFVVLTEKRVRFARQ
jgi:predicted nuclease of predicted toxin-antitoxin system